MEDLTGKQLGQYQIVAPLGEGGMAAVYKAYHPAMERYVAIKVLPRNMASSEEFTSRFRREARLLAQLQHPHILPVFDYGEADGYPYIVMPFVQSGTLAELLHKQRLPLAQTRRMITQIGDALGYAHAHGMIHRDIKPSNVLIDESGNCLLTDFGLARMVEASTKLTSSGSIMGTPAYMSPEQGAGSTIDNRSDIYSLGIILYEMVTSRVPYTAETPVAVVFKHIQDPLPPARKFNPDLSESVEVVLLKALAKSPENRYQTAQEFVQAVQAAIPGTPLNDKDSARIPITTKSQPVPSLGAAKPQTSMLKYALIGIASLCVLGIGILGISALARQLKQTQASELAETQTAVNVVSEELPTRTPTATRSPSQTPSQTATSMETYVTIAVSRATLYKGPGLAYGLAAKNPYPKGEKLTVIAKNPSSLWLLCKAPDGNEGWLYMEWVKLSTDSSIIPTASFIPPPPVKPTRGPRSYP